MSSVECLICILQLKDNLIIISLFHIIRKFFLINLANDLFYFTLLVILQYLMIPIRIKINYFNNKLNFIHKLFSCEVSYDSWVGKHNYFIYAHEYYILKKLNIEYDINQVESYFEYVIKKECAICLDDNLNWITLPCKHELHFECIKAWYNTSNDRKCPYCMQEYNNEFINKLTC